jgi:hypothetical protein
MIFHQELRYETIAAIILLDFYAFFSMRNQFFKKLGVAKQ